MKDEEQVSRQKVRPGGLGRPPSKSQLQKGPEAAGNLSAGRGLRMGSQEARGSDHHLCGLDPENSSRGKEFSSAPKSTPISCITCQDLVQAKAVTLCLVYAEYTSDLDHCSFIVGSGWGGSRQFPYLQLNLTRTDAVM